jgi:hypothetical protein
VELGNLPYEQREPLATHRAQRPFVIQTTGFFDVASIACRLARRCAHRNAALKYLLSAYLTRIHPWDLDPGSTEASEFRTLRPVDWIWFSQSLFAAYGAVEELRVTPKASGKRPSIGSDGKWNPEVRLDLETRLKTVGVSTTERLVWHVRGGLRQVDRKLASRTSPSPRAKWAFGDIRDKKLLYIDAINHANWLRSKVTVHVGGKYLSSLSVIDVANVQHLARMLLLKAVRFHFWEHTRTAAQARMVAAHRAKRRILKTIEK